jgi:hypothetical protein
VLAVGLVILAKKLSSAGLLAVLTLDVALSPIVCAGRDARDGFFASEEVVGGLVVVVGLECFLSAGALSSTGDFEFVPFGAGLVSTLAAIGSGRRTAFGGDRGLVASRGETGEVFFSPFDLVSFSSTLLAGTETPGPVGLEIRGEEGFADVFVDDCLALGESLATDTGVVGVLGVLGRTGDLVDTLGG